VLRFLTAAAAGLALAGCGGTTRAPLRDSVVALPAADHPRHVGVGPRYRPPALSRAVALRAPIDGLRCGRRLPAQYGVHIELFAHGLVIPVSAGIGVAPPVRRSGAYVLSGGCTYPLHTIDPTGVIRIDRGLRSTPTLETLFGIWGQPLSTDRMLSFTGRVLAFVGGRPWRGSPQSIPLRRHAEIVLEIDGALLPHAQYEFPPGL
jgi:hypothetical protein